MNLDKIADGISDELWRRFQSKEIPAINIGVVREQLRVFDRRDMDYLETRILRNIIGRAG